MFILSMRRFSCLFHLMASSRKAQLSSDNLIPILRYYVGSFIHCLFVVRVLLLLDIFMTPCGPQNMRAQQRATGSNSRSTGSNSRSASRQPPPSKPSSSRYCSQVSLSVLWVVCFLLTIISANWLVMPILGWERQGGSAPAICRLAENYVVW